MKQFWSVLLAIVALGMLTMPALAAVDDGVTGPPPELPKLPVEGTPHGEPGPYLHASTRSHRAENTLGGAMSNLLTEKKFEAMKEVLRTMGTSVSEGLDRSDPDSVFNALYDKMKEGAGQHGERAWLISVGIEVARTRYSHREKLLATLNELIQQAVTADPSCSAHDDAAENERGGERYANSLHDAGRVYLATNILKGIRSMCRFGDSGATVEVPCVSQEAVRTILGTADAAIMMKIPYDTDTGADSKPIIKIPNEIAKEVTANALTPYMKALILAYGQCLYQVPSSLGESTQCKPLAALLNILGGHPRKEGGLTLFWSGDVYAKPAAANVDPNTARVISLEGSTILGKFMGGPRLTTQWSMLGAIKENVNDASQPKPVLCHTPRTETERGASRLWDELSDQFARTYGPTVTADGKPRGDEIVVFQDSFRKGNVFMGTEAPRLLLEMCRLSGDEVTPRDFRMEIIRSDKCIADRIESKREIVEFCAETCTDADVIASDAERQCIETCNQPKASGADWLENFDPAMFKELYNRVPTKIKNSKDGTDMTLFGYMQQSYIKGGKWQLLNTLENNIYCDLAQAQNELEENVVTFNKLLEATDGMEAYSDDTENCAVTLVNEAFKDGTALMIREGDLAHVALHRGIVPPQALTECEAQRARSLTEDEDLTSMPILSCSPKNKDRLSQASLNSPPIAPARLRAETSRGQLIHAVNERYLACACKACGGEMERTGSKDGWSCRFPEE